MAITARDIARKITHGMPTKISGDLVGKFGETLPVPFIEKVEIQKGYLVMTLGLYFDMDTYGGENFTRFFEELDGNGISLGCIFAVDVKATTSKEARPWYTDVVISKKNTWEALVESIPFTQSRVRKYAIWDTDSSHQSPMEGTNLYNIGFAHRVESFVDNDIIESAELFYDENNRPIRKITLIRTLNTKLAWYYVDGFGEENLYTAESADWETRKDLIDVAFDSEDIIQRLGLLAFTTTEDLDDIVAIFEESPDSLGSSQYSSILSDIGYISLVDNHYLASMEDIVFIDSENNEVENTNVLQSLGGSYYEVETALVDSIKKDMSSLNQGPSDDFQLNSIYDSISYLVEVHGSSVDFLIQLNEFKKTFPFKGNSTVIGTLYNILRDKISQANSLVRQGNPVRKEAILNPRVVNYKGDRFVDTDDASESILNGTFEAANINIFYFDGSTDIGLEVQTTQAAWDNDNAFIYPGSIRYNRGYEVGYGGLFEDLGYTDMGTIQVSYERQSRSDSYLFKDTGYFFFDYEKAIKRTSDIAQLFNIDKLERWYGPSLTNDVFRLARVDVDCNRLRDHKSAQEGARGQPYDRNDYEPLFSTRCKFVTDYTIREITAQLSWEEYTEADDPEIYYDTKVNSEHFGEQFSYVALRNIVPVPDAAMGGVSSTFPNYRLMAFQFQNLNQLDVTTSYTGVGVDTMHSETQAKEWSNLEAYTGTAEQIFYEFRVHCVDRTRRIYEQIVKNLEDAIDELEQYIDAAEQECSYNEDTAYYNNFFIDGVEKSYSDEPSSAPWVMAPLLYHFHLDLLFNVYGGSVSRVNHAAKKTSTSISPRTGNPISMQTLLDSMKTLWKNYYQSSTAIVNSPGEKYKQIDTDTTTPNIDVWDPNGVYQTNSDYVIKTYGVPTDFVRTSMYTLANLGDYGNDIQQDPGKMEISETAETSLGYGGKSQFWWGQISSCWANLDEDWFYHLADLVTCLEGKRITKEEDMEIIIDYLSQKIW